MKQTNLTYGRVLMVCMNKVILPMMLFIINAVLWIATFNEIPGMMDVLYQMGSPVVDSYDTIAKTFLWITGSMTIIMMIVCIHGIARLPLYLKEEEHRQASLQTDTDM